MRSFLAPFLVAFVVAAMPASAQHHGNPDAPIRTVEALDLARYAGLWYEIARFPNRFERGCQAVTAEYTLRQDGTMGVRNACRQGAVDGPLRIAEGSARVEGVGRLSVNFVRFLPFVRGDYFVLEVTDDYSLAVVGEPGRDYGWILSRTPRLSARDYARAVGVLQANGYDAAMLERVAQP